MWMLVNVALPVSWVMSMSRSVACAGVPPDPALRTTLTGRPDTTTDWHRSVRVASLMPETATRWFFGSSGFWGLAPFSDAMPPYCTKPVPSSLLAETLNVEPETANDAAMAPLAIPTTIAPAATAAGRATATKRRHLVRPCTRLPCASFTGGPPRMASPGGCWDGRGNRTGDEMRWVRNGGRNASQTARTGSAWRAEDVAAKRMSGQGP